MIGCRVEWKCFVACLFFESSQQPTCPHSRQSRRCTQVSPVLRHSSQPSVFGRSVFTVFRWAHFIEARCTSSRQRCASSLQLLHFLQQRLDAEGNVLDFAVDEKRRRGSDTA